MPCFANNGHAIRWETWDYVTAGDDEALCIAALALAQWHPQAWVGREMTDDVSIALR